MDFFLRTGLSMVFMWASAVLGGIVTLTIIAFTLLNQNWDIPFAEQDWSNLWWALVSAVVTVLLVAAGFISALFGMSKATEDFL